jgi:hypothetical protein
MVEFNSTPEKKEHQKDSAYKQVSKNHIKAARFAGTTQKSINTAIDQSYHTLIEHVKKLYSKLPNVDDRIVVEMNRAQEPNNPISIYCFMTPHFYFYLECDVMLRYRVEYQLFNCPYEKEITKAMKQTILRSYSTEIMKMPNYQTFFKEVLRVQPDKFKRVV